MKRSLVAASVAVLLAVFGCAVVLIWVRNADNRAVANKEPVTVLVATKRIPAGTTGAKVRSGGYVESVVMARSTVPEDALKTLDSSLDKLIVTYDIQPSQLVLRGAFGEAGSAGGGLALPDGKMALSIPVVAASLGFVHPGSKIAIFDTFTSVDGTAHVPDGNHGPKYDDLKVQVTRLVLPSVDVVAVGQTSATGPLATSTSKDSKTADSASAIPGPADIVVITLAVTQEEAEKLVLAVQTGLVYAALLADTSVVKPAPGADTKNLFA